MNRFRTALHAFTAKEWTVIALVFVSTCLSSSLFAMIDEKPFEGILPWFFAIPAFVGILFTIPLNIPLIPLMHFFHPVAYESYFAILPYLTGLLWAMIAIAMMALVKHLPRVWKQWTANIALGFFVALTLMSATAVAAICFYYAPLVQEPTASGHMFNTSARVPGTRLTLFYPYGGFYGHGAIISEDASDGARLRVTPSDTYNQEHGAEFFHLLTIVRDLPAGQYSLEDVVNAIGSDTMEGRYASTKGYYKTIRGQRYFLYQVPENPTMWNALTILDGQIIVLIATYQKTDFPASMEAYRLNDTLFMDIISRLHVTR